MNAKSGLLVLLDSIDAIAENAAMRICRTLCLCPFATLPLFLLTEVFTRIRDDRKLFLKLKSHFMSFGYNIFWFEIIRWEIEWMDAGILNAAQHRCVLWMS